METAILYFFLCMFIYLSKKLLRRAIYPSLCIYAFVRACTPCAGGAPPSSGSCPNNNASASRCRAWAARTTGVKPSVVRTPALGTDNIMNMLTCYLMEASCKNSIFMFFSLFFKCLLASVLCIVLFYCFLMRLLLCV